MKGSVSEEGFFHVNDVVYAGEETHPLARANNNNNTSSASSSSSSSSSSTAGDTAMAIEETTNNSNNSTDADADADDDTYMLLVSGLQVGAGAVTGAVGEPSPSPSAMAAATAAAAAAELSVQLLMDFVSGRLGGAADIALASRIVRVVVAGNSVVETTVRTEHSSSFLSLLSLLPLIFIFIAHPLTIRMTRVQPYQYHLSLLFVNRCHLFIDLSSLLFDYLPVWLSGCLSIYLSVYLSTSVYLH